MRKFWAIKQIQNKQIVLEPVPRNETKKERKVENVQTVPDLIFLPPPEEIQETK